MLLLERATLELATDVTDEADNNPKDISWPEANQNFLSAAIAVVRLLLEAHIAREEGSEWDKSRHDAAIAELEAAKEAMPDTPRLERLFRRFDLEPGEIDLLLLCAGMELVPAWPQLCAKALDDDRKTFPTFALAATALPDFAWESISPASSLLRWRFLEVESEPNLMTGALSLDENIFYYLMGLPYSDRRFSGIIEPLSREKTLAPSHQTLAKDLAAAWQEAVEREQYPALQLCGLENADKREIAAATAEHLGLSLSVANLLSLPTRPAETQKLLTLWDRECLLFNQALLIECDENPESDRLAVLNYWLENGITLIIISSRDRSLKTHYPLLTFDVEKPPAAEQRELWLILFAERELDRESLASQLVFQFNLTYPAIHATWTTALARGDRSQSESATAPEISRILWDTCRRQARQKLDDLVHRIEPKATWDDLVLPETQQQTLKEIAAEVRQRATIYETWGFGQRGSRGLGISALFSGSSGTGKTLAAEILARELQLDLYRIDLSAVMSKYIGETEKSLRRAFHAAESGGAILLFDEADALFGKRSEVKDSHDRYANVGISYLLQQMEAYRGLAILTTNLQDSLDTAFLRRLRFIIHFPFPDRPQRELIWQRMFPPQMPRDGLDVQKLAQLNASGGTIRNIALKAAFLAADDGKVVSMPYLLQATLSEYRKLEKSLTLEETEGWVE